MRLLHIFFCLLSMGILCEIMSSQETPPQNQSSENSCDGLKGTVSDNVRAMATNLKVCHDLQRVLQHGRIGIEPPGALSSLETAPGGPPGTGPSQLDQADAHEKAEELEARQNISEAITRAALDSNLVLLQLRNVRLQEQLTALDSEERAYRRTKILNAFLGTTVGAVGSGLQFSNSVKVQHAGDAVSVGGGVITAVFALCTTELTVTTPTSDDQLSQAFQDDNQGHQLPDKVWDYVKGDNALRQLMMSVPQTPTTPKKVLSCHFRQPPSNKVLAERERALSALDNKLLRMNRDIVELSKVAFSQ